MQDSNQENIIEAFKGSPEFIKVQAKITIDIIKEIRPRLVIVCNSLVDKILHEFKNEIEFFPKDNEDKTVYFIENNENKKIPFVIKESKFMGSRIHSHNIYRKEALIKEISKVLSASEKWFE